MKKTLLTSLACGALTSLLFANARVQIVHNSPDPLASVVDIYVNNGETPAVDDLAYRNATGFVDLPSGEALEIDIAPGNSTSADQAVATVTYTLEDGKTYYLIADGELSDGFNTYVFDEAKEDAPVDKTNLTIYHGSLDAGVVDVRETSVATDLAESLNFSSFSDILELDAQDYFVELRDEDQTTTVAAFDVPLSLFNGQSVLAIASGYASGDNANFGLFAVPAGGGEFISLDASTAKAQIIHNSPNAGEVDIYINDEVTGLTNVPFRYASAYVEVPVGLNQKFSVNLAGTNTEAISTVGDIEGGQNYIMVAVGDGENQDLDLSVAGGARMEASEDGNTDVTVFHGSTDAPEVNVTLTDGNELISDLPFGEFSEYLELPTDDYVLQVRASSNDNVVETYDVPLETLELEGEGLTVVASGYLAPEDDEPAFGLFVALSAGGELIELPVHEATARVQIVHNSPDENAGVVDIYVNDGENPAVDDLAYRNATGFVDLPAGSEIEIDIAPGTSTSSDDAVATVAYTLEEGKTYYLIADGELGNGFNTYVFDNAAENASSDEQTSLTIYHGSLDAGVVDVQETSVPAILADAIGFGEFSDRYELDSDKYYVELRDDEQTTTVAAFDVPLDLFSGESVLAIASGYASGDDANFGLFAVPASGGEFITLDASTAKAQIIHNSPAAEEVDIYINDEITGLTNVPFRYASAYVEVPVGLNQKFSVNLAGTNTEAISTVGDIEGGQNYIMVAVGDGENQDLDLSVIGGTQMEADEDTNTDVIVFHGSTDAPEVNVTLTDGSELVSDLPFGEFSEYLELPTDDYLIQVRVASNDAVVATYSAPLAELELEGQALAVIASGYVGDDTPEFGLFVALSEGGALIPLEETVPTSLTENVQSNLVVYPNPTSGIINIGEEITSYTVSNSLGSIVNEGSSQKIDITDLPSGIYVVTLQGDNFSTKAQIIKK